MGVTLGSGWQPRLPPEPEVLPDPTLAVLEAVALLREGLANLPVPVVHVAPQDLTDIVTAVSSLHGPTGPSASDIAAAVREALAPSLEREEPETARKMLEALERLDFRMKGQGMSGVGGTVATISSISDVVRTSPEPGYVWPVSGTVATSGLTDAELRAAAVPVSLATAPTTPVTGTFWQTTQPVSAATLPLPTGAAQNTTLTDGSVRVGGTVAVQDKFSTGQILADQAGAGAVLTFTFSSPVNLVWVTDSGAVTTNVSRADPFGGTPSATLGIPVLNAAPTPLTVTTSSVKVYAPAGTTISVHGYAY